MTSTDLSNCKLTLVEEGDTPEREEIQPSFQIEDGTLMDVTNNLGIHLNKMAPEVKNTRKPFAELIQKSCGQASESKHSSPGLYESSENADEMIIPKKKSFVHRPQNDEIRGQSLEVDSFDK